MIKESHVNTIISIALRRALQVQILVNTFVNIEFAAEIFMQNITEIVANSLVPIWYNENSLCIRILEKES